ncbi:Uncharacterised protein g1200 [Pycnogonum litorale]
MILTNFLTRSQLLFISFTLIGFVSYSILVFVAKSVSQDVFNSIVDRWISEYDDAIEPSATNRTVGDTGLLIYNRIPKCGSTTFNLLLKSLSQRNGYRHFSSNVYHKRRLTIGDQEQFVRKLKSMEEPLSVDRHLYFVNFTKFNETSPIYMNVVRDPMDRLISSFYYVRKSSLKKSKNDPKLRPSQSWLDLTYDQCVRRFLKECQVTPGKVTTQKSMVPFFCGHAEMCSVVGNRWALEKAKYNIEHYFAVVGVLEDMEKTLAVLENYVPLFFSGALKMYNKRNLHGNANKRKVPVSRRVKEMVKKNLTLEYELYAFIKRRLDKQYEMITKIRK